MELRNEEETRRVCKERQGENEVQITEGREGKRENVRY